MKLLLFDIDGTILLTQGVGRIALEAALSEALGRTVTTDGVRFSGRTDPSILSDALAQCGVPSAEASVLLPAMLDVYVKRLRASLTPDRVRVLPGVHDLLLHLADRPDVQLGLLTGNLEPTAYLKLGAAGLAALFPFGAFGSDHADRSALPALAVQRALAYTGHAYRGKDVVIIGDTEHDILCGRGVGAFSVAVCTGRYDRTDLKPHAPDVLLDDLTDLPGFLRRVLAAQEDHP